MHQELVERVITLAEESLAKGSFPNGSLVALGEEIVAESISMSEQVFDPTAHAEMTALRRACELEKKNNLEGYTLYTSLEPCLMCFHASYWTGIRRIVAACKGDRVDRGCYEGVLSAREVVSHLNHKVELIFDDTHEARVQSLHREWKKMTA